MTLKLYMDEHVDQAITGGLREAARRQQAREAFAGLIYAHQLNASIGQCVQDLELLALACDPDEFLDRVEYLLLR